MQGQQCQESGLPDCLGDDWHEDTGMLTWPLGKAGYPEVLLHFVIKSTPFCNIKHPFITLSFLSLSQRHPFAMKAAWDNCVFIWKPFLMQVNTSLFFSFFFLFVCLFAWLVFFNSVKIGAQLSQKKKPEEPPRCNPPSLGLQWHSLVLGYFASSHIWFTWCCCLPTLRATWRDSNL